jgi:hypothetical protein
MVLNCSVPAEAMARDRITKMAVFILLEEFTIL